MYNCIRENSTGEIFRYGTEVYLLHPFKQTICYDVGRGKLDSNVPMYHHKLVANSSCKNHDVSKLASYESYDFHLEEMTSSEKKNHDNSFSFGRTITLSDNLQYDVFVSSNRLIIKRYRTCKILSAY